MKKKILAIVMSIVLVCGIVCAFAACGEKTPEKKTVVVGYTIYEPMNYLDESGKLIGYDTELAEKVFGNLGYEVIFKEIEWSSKYTDLDSGTIDCVWNGFTANTADDDGVLRSDKVDFSYNYMENLQVVVAKKDTVKTAADLKGKLGVAESGSAGEAYAKGFEGTTYKGFLKQTDCLLEVKGDTADFAVVDAQLAKAFEGTAFKGFTKQTECLTEVVGKTADFAVVDAQLAKSYVGNGDYADLAIVEELSSDVEYYAIGFKKGSELTANVNAQLEALAADGTIAALAEKYGVSNTAITDFSDQK